MVTVLQNHPNLLALVLVSPVPYPCLSSWGEGGGGGKQVAEERTGLGPALEEGTSYHQEVWQETGGRLAANNRKVGSKLAEGWQQMSF